nr:hypothetical protein KitaXyl93_23470 [Kitasatospora sp. Xyl93]
MRWETWTTEEFGASHEGSVGVLLPDGTVPKPVYIQTTERGAGETTSQWYVYDGGDHLTYKAPRADKLRGVCSCGWTGPSYQLDWDQIGEESLHEAAGEQAAACEQDWDGHAAEVDKSAIALPDDIAELVSLLGEKLETLGQTSPLAALRAARQLEVTAERTAYWPAHDVRRDIGLEQAAAALGLNEDGARSLLGRFGRWSPYS